MTVRREKAFRGISLRLARRYLENLGGVVENDHAVEGDDWRVELSAEKVAIGPSLQITEITVVFEGDEDALDDLIPAFSQKAMRAGG